METLVVPTSARISEIESGFIGAVLESSKKRIDNKWASEVVVARRDWDEDKVQLFVPTSGVRAPSEPYLVNVQTWYDALLSGKGHYAYGRIFPDVLPSNYGISASYGMHEVIEMLRTGEELPGADPNAFDFFLHSWFGDQPGFMKFGFNYLHWHRREGEQETWRHINTKGYETYVKQLGGKPYG